MSVRVRRTDRGRGRVRTGCGLPLFEETRSHPLVEERRKRVRHRKNRVKNETDLVPSCSKKTLSGLPFVKSTTPGMSRDSVDELRR